MRSSLTLLQPVLKPGMPLTQAAGHEEGGLGGMHDRREVAEGAATSIIPMVSTRNDLHGTCTCKSQHIFHYKISDASDTMEWWVAQ